MANRIEGPTLVTGATTFASDATITLPANSVNNAAIQAGAAIARTKLAQDVLAEYVIPPSWWRTWDALATNLPATPAADDLGLVTGTLATNYPLVQTGDVKTTSSTRYARTQFSLPPEYDAGETINVRIRGGMQTTVADGSCTVDVQCYRHDGDGGVSADLCTTAAQSINVTSYANKDFVITATTFNPGDEMDIRIAVIYVDGATGTVVIGSISQVAVLLDVRG